MEVRSLVSVNRNIFQHFRSCSCTGGTKKSTDPDCFCFLLDQVVTDHLGGANTKAALWVTFGWICAEIQAQVFFSTRPSGTCLQQRGLQKFAYPCSIVSFRLDTELFALAKTAMLFMSHLFFGF